MGDVKKEPLIFFNKKVTPKTPRKPPPPLRTKTFLKKKTFLPLQKLTSDYSKDYLQNLPHGFKKATKKHPFASAIPPTYHALTLALQQG
jgi:hypothetical protein